MTVLHSRPLLRLAVLLAGGLAAQPSRADNIEQIYERARDSNPVLAAARAGHKAVLEQRPQARAGLLPEVNVSGGFSDERFEDLDGVNPPTNPESTTGSVEFTQPLFRLDRWVALKQAGSRIAEADANLAAARQELIVTVAERYFDLLAAQDSVAFARAEKDAIALQLETVQLRFEGGLVPVADVHEAQAAYDLAVSREIDAENGLHEAREALREVAGQYYDGVDPLRDELPMAAPEPDSIEDWVNRARENNLRILAGEAAVKTARHEVWRQRAGHLPSLDLNGKYEYLDGSFEGIAAVKRTSSEVEVELNLPLYAGGAIRSRTREAWNRFQQSTEELNRTTRNVDFETRKAFRGMHAAMSQVETLSHSVASIESALEAEQAGYEAGTRTFLNVLDVQRALYGAKSNHARARYRYLVEGLRLKRAAGALDETALADINRYLTTAD